MKNEATDHMAGKDVRSNRENALQLDRLLVERVRRYEPDDQLVARDFNRQPSMRGTQSSDL